MWVQALEKKVEILVHSKRAEGRHAGAERRDYATQIEDLKRALEMQAEAHRKQVRHAPIGPSATRSSGWSPRDGVFLFLRTAL